MQQMHGRQKPWRTMSGQCNLQSTHINVKKTNDKGEKQSESLQSETTF